MSIKNNKFKRTIVPALVVAVMASLIASPAPAATKLATAPTIRVGYFANLTHAPALIARQKKLFEKYLGNTKVEYTYFTAGPAAIEAIKGNALDVAYIGPNPSISGFLSTDGTLLKIVGGATSGGASFIVKSSLAPKVASKPTAAEIAALAGKTFASPQLGGTQDVALRKYLKGNGLTSTIANITPLANADTLTQFKAGNIDGAWVPEPWATRLILEGSGKVFLDETTLWAKGRFVTTNIVARKKFLNTYPGSVKAILQANYDAIQFLTDTKNTVAAKDLVQAELLAGSGKRLADNVIDAAWPKLTYTNNPIPESLSANFKAAVKVGQLNGYLESDLKGIYSIKLLNSILRSKGKTQVVIPSGLIK